MHEAQACDMTHPSDQYNVEVLWYDAASKRQCLLSFRLENAPPVVKKCSRAVRYLNWYQKCQTSVLWWNWSCPGWRRNFWRSTFSKKSETRCLILPLRFFESCLDTLCSLDTPSLHRGDVALAIAKTIRTVAYLYPLFESSSLCLCSSHKSHFCSCQWAV